MQTLFWRSCRLAARLICARCVRWPLTLIRPWALGRSNWLFAGSLRSGKRAAAIMSLIQSARINGHDPYAYLKDVLRRLPTQKASEVDQLLPHQWMPGWSAQDVFPVRLRRLSHHRQRCGAIHYYVRDTVDGTPQIEFHIRLLGSLLCLLGYRRAFSAGQGLAKE